MFRSLRNAFITGLIAILPLGVTIIVINFLLERLGTPASNVFFGFLDRELRDQRTIKITLQVLSILVVFVLITALGYGSRFFIGKFLFLNLENALNRVPFINTVYRTVKQIVDTFSQQEKAVFQEVVLIEYPRPECYALAFLTSDTRGEIQARTSDDVVNVFVPTTPNPTSGFLLMLPKDDVTRLRMSIGDGMKLIISGGAVVPAYDGRPAPAEDSPPANRPWPGLTERDGPSTD